MTDPVEKLRPWLVGEPNSEGEWRAFCPIHEDPSTSKSSSAMINFESGVWICNSAKCGDKGSIARLISKLGGKTPKSATKEKPKKPLPTDTKVREWTRNLLKRDRLLAYLTDERGLTKGIIREWGVGHNGVRYTIPVRDERSKLVNVRMYKPRARNNKMISWGAGHGQGRLMGWDVLHDDDVKDIVLVEGEWDMLIGRVHDLPSVATTGGVGSWRGEWTPAFAGKNVYICFDDDTAGQRGAQQVASHIKGVAAQVWKVSLNTSIKGGDLTDFFTTLGHTNADFMTRMKEARLMWEDDTQHTVPTTGKQVSIEESLPLDEPIELVVTVAGKSPAYKIPEVIEANCSMSAAENVCAQCPLAIDNGNKVKELFPDDPINMEFIDASKQRAHELGRKMFGTKCSKHVEFTTLKTRTVEEMEVQPSVEHSYDNESVNHISQRVLVFGSYKTPVNRPARIVGRSTPSPRDHHAVIHGWDVEAVNDSIDNFHMTDDMRSRLRKFQPSKQKKESVLDKCLSIASDLSHTVTRIYGRDIMHVAYDLVWHSAISFNFQGQQVTKGWLECLVIGDTRTGKSETANALRRHYRAGEMTSCEGSTLVGLVGGAVGAMGGNNRWMVTWGRIPMNDRRLVILDEMSGFTSSDGRQSKGILEQMSSVRSEGKAQVDKVAKGEASARTRLIWISNPVNGHRLTGEFGSGLKALNDLVRSPEDIARFDFVMAAANEEVPTSEINRLRKNKRPHYTSDDCHDLAMWAWSRKPEDINWSTAAEAAVLAAAEDLGSRYTPDPPLIQAENVRLKIARLAVAFAIRTFSTGKSGRMVRVRTWHVEAAVEFLDLIYKNEHLGYADHSEAVLRQEIRAQGSTKECRRLLEQTPELIYGLKAMGNVPFTPRDLEENSTLTRDEARDSVKKLRQYNMITTSNRRLRMSPALAKILRDMEIGTDDE